MFLLLISLMSLLALGFVVVPLYRSSGTAQASERTATNAALFREQLEDLQDKRERGDLPDSEFEQRQLELEKRLLEDTHSEEGEAVARGAGPLLLALPLLTLVATVFIYLDLGSYQQWKLAERYAQMGAAEDNTPQALQAFTNDVASFTQRHPQSEWLFVQAQSYMQLADYQAAADTFASLAETFPEDADMVARHAQALYLARGRTMDRDVTGLIDQALALNPHQPTILGMMGIHAFEQKEYARAIEAWQQAIAGLPPSAPARTLFEDGIRQARSLLGESPVAATAPDTVASQAAVEGFSAGIRVVIAAGPGVDAAANHTVFVVAQAPAGGPPLAVARLTVADLPAELLLDDAMAMVPGHNLSANSAVRLTARISRSGLARPEPGDWQARSPVLTPLEAPEVVELLIREKI